MAVSVGKWESMWIRERSSLWTFSTIRFSKKYGLQLRNRIIWRFGHGLHASNSFSGRYKIILWFTKSDDYTFNLDAVRVPSKYSGKRYFKGPNKGQPSGNPLGKNPNDIWTTIHEDDWILDPFAGVGSTVVAALKN